MNEAIGVRVKDEAQIHLYDHLTKWERGLKIPGAGTGPLTEERHQDVRQGVIEFAEAESDVAGYGVEDWAKRLLDSLIEHRRERAHGTRPLIFICHSTGGNVLKHALTRKADGKLNEIAVNTIGITFFAVPHHGSTVLSGNEYVPSVKDHLGLKWKMSWRLRRDFRLRDKNEALEMLNHDFAVDMVGVKIHSYAEVADTHLDVLTSADTIGGEGTAVIRLCIVDSRSGRLGTPQAPVEDEDFIQLDVNHVNLPRFSGNDQDEQYDIYLAAIQRLVTDYDPKQRKAYQDLKKKIMTEIRVHVHQFYGNRSAKNPSMKILLTKPTLETFLESGPAKVMADRIEGRDQDLQASVDKLDRDQVLRGSIDRPKLDLQPASDNLVPLVPTFKVEAVDADEASDDAIKSPTSKLAPPSVPLPKSIHTPRPPRLGSVSEPGLPENLGLDSVKSAHPKVVSFPGERIDRDADKEPQRAAAFLLPSQAPDRFKWIHVPFTNAGWVHHILGRISKEKHDLNLHHHLLKDKLWFNQHNQSRHASPHALFVRPCVKGLTAEGAEIKHSDGSTTPSGASNHIQLVVYMPYLHWDSFVNMKKRADIIKRRKEQANQIPGEILNGKSTEHR